MCFSELMTYLYTGRFDTLDAIQAQGAADSNNNKDEQKKKLISAAIEFLRLADSEVLDDVKLQCELTLIKVIHQKNFTLISEAADKYNADRLKEYCGWFHRTHNMVCSELSDVFL